MILNIDTLIAQAEWLCRSIAPHDLAGRPLYVVPQSRVPDSLGGRAVCDGFTAPNLDLYLRTSIGSKWQGRGPCLVVNDTDFGGTMDAVDIDVAFLGTVLHELAHILEHPTFVPSGGPVDPLRIQFNALCVGRIVAEEPAEDETEPPFRGHEARFIRAVLHLRHRAEVLGITIALCRLCAGRQYGLSHANRYRDALGDEPRRLADLSIRQVLRRPLPESFLCLWSEDMFRWLGFSTLDNVKEPF